MAKKRTQKRPASRTVYLRQNVVYVTEPWYQQTGIIALLMIFFFPLGIALLWAHPKYQKRTKIMWTLVYASFFLLLFTGWFGAALIASTVLWGWTITKHPLSSADDAPSGKICAYCGAQIPNSGICSYCGGKNK